ncbi:MAG: sigma-E factor negative regulatory protein [Proteobacteria bacterium]|nr:sigma-E factor negative regulatory protein [Pseudomonadota bacterium]
MEEHDSREHLSALMDGELGAEPARFLLRRMEHDPELARAWSRWLLARACLAQRAATASPHSDPLRIAAAGNDDAFVARVMEQTRTFVQPRRHWARFIGGGAIAASVAAAALMLSVPQSTSTDGTVGGGADRTVRAVAQSPSRAAPAAARIAAAPAGRNASMPWLDRQPAFLAARPGVAGSMLSGNYLQQAAYAPDAAVTPASVLSRDPQRQSFDGAPYLILLVPEQATRPQAAQQH